MALSAGLSKHDALGVVHPEAHGADAGAVLLEALGSGAVRLGVQHEVGAAVAVERHRLGAVPARRAEAERAQEGAEFLRGRNLDYVRAARALGVSDARLMARHILPNAMVATLTFLPFILSGSVVVLTSLDFLGFGLPPGSASLGELVAQGKNNLQAPWLAGTGFVVLGGVLTLLVFVGEAVRDAFDPRKLPGGTKA